METNLPPGSFPGNVPNLRPLIGPLTAVIIAFAGLATVFYQIGPDEVGVVQRFGLYVRTTPPGLHMKFPFGIETAKGVKVTHVFKEEFGFRTVQPGVRTVYEGREGKTVLVGQGGGERQRLGLWQSDENPFLDESLMLTGDLNAAVVEWIVQYRVKDPVHYLFKVRNAKETIRNMSEAMMRLVVGDHTINEVLTSGREQVRTEVEKELQAVLDSYESGIEILNVVLQDVNPPDQVKPSFNEVNEARQEKEKLINQAWEEYNRVVPKARGEAEKMIREAEGYAVDRVNRAKGDAERFERLLQAYQEAPFVTRKRLYVEMIRKLLPTVQEKIVIDQNQKGILPFLNLSEKKEAQA